MNKIRKILPLVALVGLSSFSFAACDDNDPPPPPPSTTTQPTRTITEPTTPPTREVVVESEYTRQEKILLTTIRNGSYSDQYASDSDARVVQVAHALCAKLDSGVTVDSMIATLQSELDAAGSTERQAQAVGYFLGASVAALCPEYNSELEVH